MTQFKSIVFAILFCLSFCTPPLYALGPDEVNPQKQEADFSLEAIAKSIGGTIDGLGKSLDGTVNGLGQLLGETVDGLGKFLGETVDGLGELFDETGEVAEDIAGAAIVIGAVIIYIMAEVECHNNYGYQNQYHGYGRHGYYRYDHYLYNQCYQR